MALCPRAYRMNTKGGMHLETHTWWIAAAAAICMAPPPPLVSILGLRAELLKQIRCVARHELMPLHLGKGGQPLTHGMGGPPKPPGQGMVDTVAISRHADYGTRM